MNLENLTYDELQNAILLEDDLKDFYATLDEEKFLNKEYSFDELNNLLTEWMTINDDCEI